MSRTDTIADTFTMIRNAIMAKKDVLDVPGSNMVKAILEILKKEDYIDNFKTLEDSKHRLVRVYLKYTAGKPAIRMIKRVSRPGLRMYTKKDSIPVVIRGRGIAIVSTSKGLVTGTQARTLGLGGEVIGYIY